MLNTYKVHLYVYWQYVYFKPFCDNSEIIFDPILETSVFRAIKTGWRHEQIALV